MSKQTVQQAATEALTCLTYDEKLERWICKDKNPLWSEWVRDMIYAAHDGMMPDDYKYEYAVDALGLIADADESADLDEVGYEIEADVYTASLTKWLASNVNRVYYLTEALEEWETKDGFQALGQAQIRERQDVFQAVLAGVQARVSAA